MMLSRAQKLEEIRKTWGSGRTLKVLPLWELSFDREYDFPMNPRKSMPGKKKTVFTREESKSSAVRVSFYRRPSLNNTTHGLHQDLLQLLTECQSLSLRFHKGQTFAVTCRNENTWSLQRGSNPSDPVLSDDTSRLFLYLETKIDG
jgi:hypothetical protein